MSSFSEALGPSPPSGASFGEAMTMRSSGKGFGNLQILQDLFGGTVGTAFDFTKANNLFQDSGGTTPVTTGGDLVGLAVDDSGNGNDAIQPTAAAKLQWVDNGSGLYGVQAINSGGYLYKVLAGSNDTTVVALITDPTATPFGWAAPFLQYTDGNVHQKFDHPILGTWRIYQKFAGGALAANFKTGSPSGSTNTIRYTSDASPRRAEGKYNDETPVAFTDFFANVNFGNTQHFGLDFNGHIHRMIFLRRLLTSDELDTAATLVQEGW